MNLRFMDFVRGRFDDRGFSTAGARRRSVENLGMGVSILLAAAAVIGLVVLFVDTQGLERHSPFVVAAASAGVFGFYGLLLVFRGTYGLLTGAAFNVTGEAAPGEAKHRAGFSVLFLGAFFSALVTAFYLASS